MIKLDNVSKYFGKTRALSGFTLHVNQSECLGIIGPNGSGKTTLLNLIVGLITPSEGIIERDISIEKGGIGYSMSNFGFFPDVLFRQQIKLLYAYKNMPINRAEVDYFKSLFHVDTTFEKPFRSYSSGMKQKLSIISAFVGAPACIILDEPTNGLDVDAVFALKNHISETTFRSPILITSHSLDHLESVCDRLIFLKNGSLLYEGYTEEIVEKYGDLETAYRQIIWSENLLR